MVQFRLRVFIIANGLYGIQCKHSYGVIATTKLNPISCERQLAVAIAPCEQPLAIKLTENKPVKKPKMVRNVELDYSVLISGFSDLNCVKLNFRIFLNLCCKFY